MRVSGDELQYTCRMGLRLGAIRAADKDILSQDMGALLMMPYDLNERDP